MFFPYYLHTLSLTAKNTDQGYLKSKDLGLKATSPKQATRPAFLRLANISCAPILCQVMY